MATKSKFNVQLCQLKLLYFFELANYSALFVYLSPFMISWGVTITELAIITSVANLITFFTRPLFGFIADKYQNYKEIIIFISCSCSIAYFLHLASPKHEQKIINYILDKNVSISFDIDNASILMLLKNQTFNASWPFAMKNCTFDLSDGIDFTRNAFNESYATYQSSYKNYSIIQRNYSIVRNDSMLCVNVNQTFTKDYKFSIFWPNREKIAITYSMTFWILGFLKIITFCIFSPMSNLTDSLIFLILGKERSNEYGYTRMFGAVGILAFSIVTGALLYLMNVLKDVSPIIMKIQSYSSFSICFLLEVLIFTVVIIIISFIKTDKLVAEKKIKQDQTYWAKFMNTTSLNMLFINIEISTFFIFAIFAGFVISVHLEYLIVIMYKKFPDLPKYIPGLMVAVMTLSETLIFGVSGKMLNSCRYEFWISFTFIICFFRWLVYSFLYKFWHFIMVEFCYGLTFGLQISSMITYIGRTANPSNQGRVQGLFSSLYFNIGGGLGALIGGIVLDNFGNNGLFRFMSVLSLIFGVLYYPLQVWIIPRCRKKISTNNYNGIEKNVETLLPKSIEIEINI